MMLRVTAVLCGVLLLCWQPAAHATVLRQASVEELARAATLIVHGFVADVDDHRSTKPDGPFLTFVDLEIIATLKGHTDKTLQLIVPGGSAGGLTMAIPGMPAFSVGDEVVLLLERRGDGGLALAGLGQGVFKVERGAAAPPVAHRLTGPVMLVDARGVEIKQPTGRTFELEALLERLRRAARATEEVTP